MQDVFIELDNGLVDFVEDGNGVSAGFALYRDVVGGIAVTHREAILLARDDVDVGDFAQVNGSLVAPADDQLIQLRRLELSDKPNRVLAAPDVCESARRIRRARYRRDDVIDLYAERGCPV